MRVKIDDCFVIKDVKVIKPADKEKLCEFVQIVGKSVLLPLEKFISNIVMQERTVEVKQIWRKEDGKFYPEWNKVYMQVRRSFVKVHNRVEYFQIRVA